MKDPRFVSVSSDSDKWIWGVGGMKIKIKVFNFYKSRKVATILLKKYLLTENNFCY